MLLDKWVILTKFEQCPVRNAQKNCIFYFALQSQILMFSGSQMMITYESRERATENVHFCIQMS